MTAGHSDPAGGAGALLNAAQWLEGLLSGPVATALAILAIAAIGLSMLSGRVPVRRGLTMVLGCFLLFGAPAIARGIIGSANEFAGPASPPPSAPAPVTLPTAPPAVPAQPADPYAGASVAG